MVFFFAHAITRLPCIHPASVCAQFRDPASDISMHLQHESYRELMSARLPLTSPSPVFTSKTKRAIKAAQTTMASDRGAQASERRVTLVSARSFRHRWTGMRKYSCVDIACVCVCCCKSIAFRSCFVKRAYLIWDCPLFSDPSFFQGISIRALARSLPNF